MQAFWQAVLVTGTISNLADRIGAGRSTVGNWVMRGRVPAEHCPAIERETGVRCEALRPDVPWGVLRQCSCKKPAKSKGKKSSTPLANA
jgi:DNA-binding transcriptional regulator YdaS (Cro superfamily)